MKKYHLILIAIFLGVLIWSGINPSDRQNWLLESMPAVAVGVLIVFLARYIKLSYVAYILFTIYLCSLLVTSHFGVTNVPFGEWLGQVFGTDRNTYDRFTHFLFGFLCFYPMRELTVRYIKDKGVWSYALPFMAVFAFSSLYEIGELVAAEYARTAVGISFVGAQGDLWDGTKDMAIAGIGATIALIISLIVEKIWKLPSKKSGFHL